MAARGALSGSPLVGAGIAGALAAGAVKATGGSWWEAGGAAAGAGVGQVLGQAGGAAAGALATVNPVGALAGGFAGGAAGSLAGAAVGQRLGGGLGRIPGAGGLLAGAALAPFFPLAGLANSLSGWIPSDQSAGEAIASTTVPIEGEPPFLGGQAPGVAYRVFMTKNNTNTGQRLPEALSGSLLGPLTTTQVSPAPGFCGDTIATPEVFIHRAGADPRSGFALYNSGSGSCTLYPWGTTVRLERVDGQSDTSGNPPGPITQEAAPSKPPRTPYRPLGTDGTGIQPGDTPPSYAPAPNNNDSLSPALRPKAPPRDAPAAPDPSPALPTGDPLAQPQTATDPTAAPQATADNVPGALTTPPANELRKLKPGQTVQIGGGTTVTGTEDGYTVSVPPDSPNTVKLPNGEVVGPGKTGTVKDEDTDQLPWWLVPALAIGGIAAIGTALKVGNPTQPGEFVQVPPTPPQAPKPAPPDTGCRCNAPLLQGQQAAAAEITDLRQRLIRVEGNQVNPVSGFGALQTGQAGILAFLQTMQNFAARAWEATRLQKVINALTLITVLHNATMISRDVGETLGYALGQGLNVLGIEDEQGNSLDVNGWFGTQANNFFKNIFGEERWAGINATWNKANRIISSASAIIWTIRSINDGTQEVLEWTAENTGKIGNALKKWGVVGERAYGPMAERVKAQDAYRRKFSRILDGLDTADDAASSFAQVTSNVLEITEEVNELGEQRANFTAAVRDLAPGAYPDNSAIPTTNAEAKANATAGPQITPADMEPSNSAPP